MVALDSIAGPGGDSAARALTRRLGCPAALRCAAVWAALFAAAAVGAVVTPSASYATTIEPGPVPAAPGLPDGRMYELVSPAQKNGNEAGVIPESEDAYGAADADGTRVLYAGTGPIGEARSGVDNFSVSERSASGWLTRAALPPPVAPLQLQDPVASIDPTSLLSSSDLTKVAFTARDPFAPSHLNFANPAFSFSSTYLTEVGGAATWIGAATVERPVPALEEVQSPSNLALVGASADLGTVYFEYYGTLVSEDAPRLPAVASNNINAWGLYEWRGGQLKAAGLLPATGSPPTEEEDPFGAVAAGIGNRGGQATSADYSNEVSRDGNTVFFVSPAPAAESGRPPQLYARIDGRTTVLVSRSNLTGLPSPTGVDGIRDLSQSHLVPFAYASPDGSRVYFTSEDRLTVDAPADSSLKEYELNLTGDVLTYLPSVTPPVIASSEDGSALVFDDKRPPHEHEPQLAIWENGRTVDIAPLPESSGLYVAPVRFTSGGSIVFQTNAAFPGFNDAGGFGEVYRYDVASEGLSCISCPPQGQSPAGTANLSNDALFHPSQLIADSRSVSGDGSEIFFDTPDRLVPQDQNEARDVYEWHDESLSLISSGTGSSGSLFLDNSASGNDVFFTTRADLSGSDSDGSFDVYDARVGGGFPATQSPSSCASACLAETAPSTSAPLASASFRGVGEQVPEQVPHPREAAGGPAPTSSAQKLGRALRACKRDRGKRRHACEARARQRYRKHPRKPPA